MDITIDNPLTLEEKDLVWLGCSIDCEGTISLRGWNKRRGSKGSSIQPHTSFCNTDVRLIDYVLTILKRLDVTPYIETCQRTAKHNPMYKIIVLGIARNYKFLSVIKPYLLAKKAQADLVIEFCERRMKKAKGIPYDQREHELKEQIGVLNLRGVSETDNYERARKYIPLSDSPLQAAMLG